MSSVVSNYTHITTNATTDIPNVCSLISVVINQPGSAWNISVQDGTGGTVIGVFAPTAVAVVKYEVKLTNSTLRVVTSGTTPGDCTVTWE